jgi:hypothetical protein
LAELRDRLRAGDVWVVGSRQYRSFEDRLISRETLRDLQKADALHIAVECIFDRFIAGALAFAILSSGSVYDDRPVAA